MAQVIGRIAHRLSVNVGTPDLRVNGRLGGRAFDFGHHRQPSSRRRLPPTPIAVPLAHLSASALMPPPSPSPTARHPQRRSPSSPSYLAKYWQPPPPQYRAHEHAVRTLQSTRAPSPRRLAQLSGRRRLLPVVPPLELDVGRVTEEKYTNRSFVNHHDDPEVFVSGIDAHQRVTRF